MTDSRDVTGARYLLQATNRRGSVPRAPKGHRRRGGFRSRVIAAAVSGVLLVGFEAVPGGPPPAVAEAHATCDGADHWHWKLWPWPHREHWVYVKSRSVDHGRYQNYFWNETEGYGEWSPDCPA